MLELDELNEVEDETLWKEVEAWGQGGSGPQRGEGGFIGAAAMRVRRNAHNLGLHALRTD